MMPGEASIGTRMCRGRGALFNHAESEEDGQGQVPTLGLDHPEFSEEDRLMNVLQRLVDEL